MNIIPLLAVLFLLALWAVLWFIAYGLYLWVLPVNFTMISRDASVGRVSFLSSLLGFLLVTAWALRVINPDSPLMHYHSLDVDVALRILAGLAMGLIPVLAIGIIGILQNMAVEQQPLRNVAGRLVLALCALCRCLWGVGVIDLITLGIISGLCLISLFILALTNVSLKPAVANATAADIAPERQRVMQLLEEGKINAHESAELLTALAQTVEQLPSSRPVPGGRKLMIAGALVALVGFLLPWFAIDLASEMRSMVGALGINNMTAQMGSSMNIPGFGQSSSAMTYICGGDVGRGMGWLALVLPLVATILPLVMPKLTGHNLKAITLVAMAAGTIITLYLLTSGMRHVTYGFWLFLLGYALLWAGTIREQRNPAA